MTKTARRVRNLKRRYTNIQPLNVNNYYEINPKGLEVVLRLMKVHGLGYDCELMYITFPIAEAYKTERRELYGINTTGQILEILDYIKQNGLLEGESKVIK